MNNQHSLDRELFIPIAISGLSIVGIIVVLVIGRSLSSPSEIPMTPSPTPFQYIYLGTEPAVTTLVPEGSELPPTEAPIIEAPTEGSIVGPTDSVPILPTATRTSSVGATPTHPSGGGFGTPIILATPTSTSASGPPLNPGTYDDIDSHFVYSGSWNSQSNVNGAHNKTLHVSLAPSSTSTITFSFIGRQVRLYYQGGSTLGRLAIIIDGESDILDQSDGSEWASETFTNGTHTVVITHAGGGSVNLDYVIIPDVPTTATPTRTATP